MAVAHVATSTPARNVLHTGGTAYTITSTTAGNLLVLAAAWFQGEGAVITGISGAGTWAEAKRGDGDANSHIAIWYAPNISGGVTSLTVTTNDDGSPTVAMQVVVMEFSGAATASPLDVAPTAATGASSTPAIASGTLAQADEVIVAVVTHVGADTTIAHDSGGGYTQGGENEDNDDGQTFNAQFKVVATTTSDTADWTLGTSRDWTAILASFKGAAAAGRTTRNTRAFPLGMAIGMGWVHPGECS